MISRVISTIWKLFKPSVRSPHPPPLLFTHLINHKRFSHVAFRKIPNTTPASLDSYKSRLAVTRLGFTTLTRKKHQHQHPRHLASPALRAHCKTRFPPSPPAALGQRKNNTGIIALCLACTFRASPRFWTRFSTLELDDFEPKGTTSPESLPAYSVSLEHPLQSSTGPIALLLRT